MTVHPWIIRVRPGYLGIPGYSDKGGVYDCPSWENTGMARLLENPAILGTRVVVLLEIIPNRNPGILVQGGMGIRVSILRKSRENPEIARLLGNPGILGQGGGLYDCPSLDNPSTTRLLGNPGILGQGGSI